MEKVINELEQIYYLDSQLNTLTYAYSYGMADWLLAPIMEKVYILSRNISKELTQKIRKLQSKIMRIIWELGLGETGMQYSEKFDNADFAIALDDELNYAQQWKEHQPLLGNGKFYDKIKSNTFLKIKFILAIPI